MGPALTSYEYVTENGVWQVFSVLQAEVLHNVENFSLYWVLQKILLPTTASHQAPYESMLLLDQECMTQRLPLQSIPGRSTLSKSTLHSFEHWVSTAHWRPNMQPPIAASLRSHPNSLYVPCTSPECWLDNSNPSVQVGPESLPNLGSPQHPLSLFIRDTALQ